MDKNWKLVKGRLFIRQGYLLLTAGDERLAQEEPGQFEGAALGLMLLSLGWGLAAIGAWGAAWMLFGDFGLLIMPSLAAAAVMVLWPFRRAAVSLAGRLGGSDPTARGMTAAMLTLVLVLTLLRLNPDVYAAEYSLPWWLAWLRPQTKIYRVLLLMPLWGGWAMIATAQFCRPNGLTEPTVAAFARGCGPIRTAMSMGLLLAATIIYFGYLPWWQLSISGAAAASAIAGGWTFSRLCGGLRRDALLAVNLLTQLVFLLAYVANRR